MAGDSSAAASSSARRTATSYVSIRPTSYDLTMASRERHDPKRGRHKVRRSPETRAWEAMHLIPEQPSFLDAGTYNQLVKLRNRLELEHGVGT